MADIGEEKASSSKGLVELSRCSENHSERDVNVVARRYHLTLPIQISTLPKTPGMRFSGDFKAIHLQDWCRFFTDHNVWHVLLGLHRPDPDRERAILSEFWRRFKIWKPNHGVWNYFDKYKTDLSRTCPLIAHGDEGRGRKRGPFLVVSYHSFLGFGTLAANQARRHRPYLSMKLNYSMNSSLTRMLTAVLPKMFKEQEALESILTLIKKDSLDMLRHGCLSAHGEKHYFAMLNMSRDWQWLVKAAHLTRSYANVEKRPRAANAVPRGICHLCLAGQLGVPFEDFSRCPAWKQTMFLPNDEPWFKRPALLDLPYDHGKPASLFSYDLWHAWHLGLGKAFLASTLALISDRMSSSSVDGRFEELTEQFLQWCDDERVPPFLSGLSKDTIGWPDRSSFPNGSWSKGHITTNLMRFVASWFRRNNVQDCPVLSMCVEATACINECLEQLYKEDLWLDASTSHDIARKGLRFMELYAKLARHAHGNRRALWIIMPKAHACHHIFLECMDAVEFHINPLAFSVQVSEDYIGKKSRLARRVDTKQVVARVLERSLQGARKQWEDAGFLRS